MDKKIENCPCCGRAMRKAKHSLSKILVRILRKAYASGLKDFHLQKDLNLTKNEYANFCKLKYFGLVDQTRFSGYWHITFKGFKFLNNKVSVPKNVYTFDRKVVQESDEKKLLSEIEDGYRYKQRIDYAKEAEPVQTIH